MRPECPEHDELLLWVAGHLHGTPRDRQVGEHLKSCDEQCRKNTQTAMFVVAAATHDVLAAGGAKTTPKPRRSIMELLKEHQEHKVAAESFYGNPPSAWANALPEHPLAKNPAFLEELADRARILAAKRPGDILPFCETFAEHLQQFPEDIVGRARSRVARAVAQALQIHGDHAAALRALAEAEEALPDGALNEDYPWINLARAASLRHLKAFPDARRFATMARDDLRRWGVGGEWKAVWQLSNIAWETGDVASSLSLACEAHDGLRREGKPEQAAKTLWTAVAAAIDSGQASLARAFLGTLEAEPWIQDRAIDQARLCWNRAKLAQLEKDYEAAATHYEEALEHFQGADAVLDAAEVILDFALLAHERHDIVSQINLAQQAAQVLENIPGQGVAQRAALTELNDGLARGQVLAKTLISLRQHLRNRTR